MTECKVCATPFDPDRPPEGPAEEAGAFLARERFGDEGTLCPACLANRGELAMMYLTEYDG